MRRRITYLGALVIFSPAVMEGALLIIDITER